MLANNYLEQAIILKTFKKLRSFVIDKHAQSESMVFINMNLGLYKTF